MSAMVRIDSVFTTSSLIFAIHDGANIKHWHAYRIDDMRMPINEWNHIYKTIYIPANEVNKSGLHFRYFGFKFNGYGHADFDDLSIKVEIDKNKYPS
jgi:hypothetical protein